MRKIAIVAKTGPAYSWDTIQAIAYWQNHGSSDKKVLQAILKVSASFPAKFKNAPSEAFRVVYLSGKDFTKLKAGTPLPHRQAEGWTVSIQMVEQIIKDISLSTNYPKDSVEVVLHCKPSPDQIVLNLSTVWADPDFNEAVEYWEDMAYQKKAKWFDEGLEFKDSQKEVIISRPQIVLADVYRARTPDGKSVL